MKYITRTFEEIQINAASCKLVNGELKQTTLPPAKCLDYKVKKKVAAAYCMLTGYKPEEGETVFATAEKIGTVSKRMPIEKFIAEAETITTPETNDMEE